MEASPEMFVQQNSNVESIVSPTDDPLHEPLLQTPSNSSAEFTTTQTKPSDSPNTESLKVTPPHRIFLKRAIFEKIILFNLLVQIYTKITKKY